MQPVSFTAASAEEAVALIRAKLGPDAVVLDVRPLPANGIARLWQKPMIEVLAHVPEPPAPEPAPDADALAEFRQQLREIRQHVANQGVKAEVPTMESAPELPAFAGAEAPEDFDNGDWRIGPVLQKTGLLPLHTQMILDQLRLEHGETAPPSLGAEIGLARAALAKFWRQPRPFSSNARHILVGPAGSGKTTCLCKWLTQAVLMENRQARVWRLDGATANMAESLSVYCDILGVPGERVWQGGGIMPEEIGFVDLPGVDWRKPLALKELAAQLKQFLPAHVHLVLNGAYDTSVFLAQIRAFSSLPIEDIIVTHLDEESRWGKLWNVTLATNYPLRFLSNGQNIPGDFRPASPEALFSRQFACK
jgi:flagellar biosynthesis protein FlhF